MQMPNVTGARRSATGRRSGCSAALPRQLLELARSAKSTSWRTSRPATRSAPRCTAAPARAARATRSGHRRASALRRHHLPGRLPHVHNGMGPQHQPEQIRWYLDGVQFHTVTEGRCRATIWTDATNQRLLRHPQRRDGRRVPGRARRGSRRRHHTRPPARHRLRGHLAGRRGRATAQLQPRTAAEPAAQGLWCAAVPESPGHGVQHRECQPGRGLRRRRQPGHAVVQHPRGRSTMDRRGSRRVLQPLPGTPYVGGRLRHGVPVQRSADNVNWTDAAVVPPATAAPTTSPSPARAATSACSASNGRPSTATPYGS